MRSRQLIAGAVLAALMAAAPGAQHTPFDAHEAYTEYNLLDAASHKFHIVRYVNQRTVGAPTVLVDEKSYFTQGDDVVFERSLETARNAIVLPAGYSLVSSNVAAQVMALADGRVKVSFENVNASAAAVVIRGRKTGAPVASSLRVGERAFDFARTLYDLQAPESHRTLVRHEYVETAPGVHSLLPFLTRHVLTSVVVTDLDTGKPLEVVNSPRGRAAVLATPITNPSQSAHLRVSGTEQDSSYRNEGGQLYFEKTLHEPRTTILLPAGWDVMAVSTPATVTTTREGRIAIQVYNPRLEPAAIQLRASRRPSGGD